MSDCECETTSQSEHSGPGLVTDIERLLRLCFAPQHLHEDGRLKEAAISKEDLVRQEHGKPPARGCSMFRQDHVDPGHMSKTATRQMERMPEERRDALAFSADVSALRGLWGEDGRSICVVDRAQPDDPSHAELWGAQPGRSRATVAAIRKKLVALLNESAGSPLIEPPSEELDGASVIG